MSGFNYHAFESPPPEWDEQEAEDLAAELDQEENEETIPFGRYKGRTLNAVRVCDIEYLGWAYRNNVRWFKSRIDSDSVLFRMVEEHCLLPTTHPRHVSRHYRKYSGRQADSIQDECHDAAMFGEH